MMIRTGTLLLFLLLACSAYAQQAGDSTPVRIINAKNLYWKRVAPGVEWQIASGNVQLQQGNTLFFCDSCIVNNAGHLFEAFGAVRIKQDTTNVYSDYLRYQTDIRLAYLRGRVRLTDGRATLTTPDLNYDVANRIGTYTNGGRLVNRKSVVTSGEGTYYTELKDVYFRRNVVVKDPAYTLRSDSLIYNTESQIAQFIAKTTIIDSTKRKIVTTGGTYNAGTGRADFISRTIVEDGPRRATADRIASDDERGIIQMEGNAVVVDTAQGTTVLSHTIFIDRKTEATLATGKPLMIIRQDDDSIYVAADTLFSARLTELYKNDTARLRRLNLKEKDSTNRYFEAFRNVRVFTDSMQAVSDSLFYSFKDSTFHLYFDPVVWARKSQITGDTIELYTKNKKADKVRVFENGFMVNEVDPGVYNQIKSTRIDGWFKEGELDSVRARGSAESVYFIQDNDSAYTSVNQTKSDAIFAYFQKGELHKVVFRSDLKGTLYPISQRQPSSMRLDRFRWLENRRPKTKYALYE